VATVTNLGQIGVTAIHPQNLYYADSASMWRGPSR